MDCKNVSVIETVIFSIRLHLSRFVSGTALLNIKTKSTMIITIDTIKKKYNALNDKKGFVKELASEIGMSFIYLLQNWFQADWKIPSERMELINEKLDLKIAEQIAELKAI